MSLMKLNVCCFFCDDLKVKGLHDKYFLEELLLLLLPLLHFDF